MTLRDRWPSADDVLYEDVVARYSEPHRRYHGLRHVEHVLATADDLSGGTAAEAVRWAAWLHDVVYDTRAADNEERSADYARDHLPALGVAPDVVAEVARLVLATKTHDAADETAAVLLDADLAILAADGETYRRYAAAVREEYAWVPDDLWRAGRLALLRSFLDKPAIFHTQALRERGEAAARANVEAEAVTLA